MSRPDITYRGPAPSDDDGPGLTQTVFWFACFLGAMALLGWVVVDGRPHGLSGESAAMDGEP